MIPPDDEVETALRLDDGGLAIIKLVSGRVKVIGEHVEYVSPALVTLPNVRGALRDRRRTAEEARIVDLLKQRNIVPQEANGPVRSTDKESTDFEFDI